MIDTMQEAPETLESADIKDSLIAQFKQKKEESNAFQKQEADEVHVREPAEDSEQMDSGIEEEEDADYSEKVKTFRFQVGDESVDVDENAEFEFKADGKNIRMTLKEMRDAAAGGVAVRNRMRILSEERKKLLDPYKNFSNIAAKDPISALKKVFGSIKGIDPKADLNQFLVALGKQAQDLTQMSNPEREAYQLRRELDETRETLSESEKFAKVQERKQYLMDEMQLSEDQIYGYGQQLLKDPVLSADIENEEDLFDRIEAFADEVQRQQAVNAALHKRNHKIPANDPLVFELSDLLRKNPDFTESDLDEVVEGILGGLKKSKASKALSKRPRSQAIRGQRSPQSKDYSKMSPKDALKAQLLEKRNSQQRR